MKKDLWVAAAALVLVLGGAGYSIAQSTGGFQGMMGSGTGMMGEGMMGQGGMMGTGMMNIMSGQPLSPEQLDQFTKLHGITVEQAKQMTETCTQIMRGAGTPQPQAL